MLKNTKDIIFGNIFFPIIPMGAIRKICFSYYSYGSYKINKKIFPDYSYGSYKI